MVMADTPPIASQAPDSVSLGFIAPPRHLIYMQTKRIFGSTQGSSPRTIKRSTAKIRGQCCVVKQRYPAKKTMSHEAARPNSAPPRLPFRACKTTDPAYELYR